MNKNLTRYYPQGNDFVEIPTPDGKQTEEKPTNKAIECAQCLRKREDIVARIVVVIEVRDDDGSIIENKGYNDGVCCKTCAFTTNWNHNILLIALKTPTLYDHATIDMGVDLPKNVGYNDGTKNAFEDRDKYRRSIIKMRDINKRLGILMPTFKVERNKTLRIRKNPLNYLTDEQKRVIVEKIKRGEIKID
jgi:hypothetical protein